MIADLTTRSVVDYASINEHNLQQTSCNVLISWPMTRCVFRLTTAMIQWS